MIEGTKPFNQAEMFKLCRGSEKKCNFDFSSISIDDYYQFFQGLPNFIYKKVKNVRFSLDLYHKFDNVDIEINDHDQEILDSSIHTNRRKFPHYLFKILNKTLPKSRTLNGLEIDGFRIPSKYFDDFVDAVKKCRTLQTIKIDNSLLTADQFLRILDTWSPYQFTNLSFVNDSLQTNQLASEIKIYLNKSGKRTWKLQSLNLAQNGFTKAQISEFNKLLKNKINPDASKSDESPPLDENSEEEDGEELLDEEEEEEEAEEAEEAEEYDSHTGKSPSPKTKSNAKSNKPDTLSLDEKDLLEEEEEEEEEEAEAEAEEEEVEEEEEDDE